MTSVPSPARRNFLARGARAVGASLLGTRRAAPADPPPSPDILTAPLELVGDWSGSSPHAVRRVALWMRAACLSDVRLLSDRQPARIRLQEQTSGPPHVWLHDDPLTTAWIVVDIGPRDWSKLAYQFGHELGHVFANSWNSAALPRPPCQWLEEAVVEAFSIRGLGWLAEDWAQDPPFPGDNAFAASIRHYRDNLIARYRAALPQFENGDLAAWFREVGAEIEVHGGVGPRLGPAIVAISSTYHDDARCVEDVGALNRWPERTGLALPEFLAKWQASCDEIEASGHLPRKLAAQLAVN